jgi:hypothetical protein
MWAQDTCVGLIRPQPWEHQDGEAKRRGKEEQAEGSYKGSMRRSRYSKIGHYFTAGWIQYRCRSRQYCQSSIHKTKCYFDSEYVVQDLKLSCEAHHLLH